MGIRVLGSLKDNDLHTVGPNTLVSRILVVGHDTFDPETDRGTETTEVRVPNLNE